VLNESRGDKSDFKIKVMVVEKAATRRKIIGNYLKPKGLGNSVPEGSFLPQAIFWLKK
jgi:hypothetical protein